MAKPKKESALKDTSKTDDLADELIDTLNKDSDDRIAYNLGRDIAPTHVKRWISTRCRLLDYIIANRRNGGFPESRIIEIFGPPSCGKSHLAAQVAISTQKLGGVVVYIDTENATDPDNLKMLGLDVSKRFVYVESSNTEEAFSVVEKSIIKMKVSNKDVPMTIIIDSIAALSPKAELEGDYDQNTIGLQARVLSKAMRKITGLIGNQNVLLICLNQVRTDVMAGPYGDPDIAPGGKAIPFHSSVRIKLGKPSQIKNKQEEVIGVSVSAKTIKNKVAPPFRKVEFQIIFGKGLNEYDQLFDLLRKHGEEQIGGHKICVSGDGAWKYLIVKDLSENEVVNKKFHKSQFEEVWNTPEYNPYLEDLLESVMTRKFEPEIDAESLAEMKALAEEVEESLE